jgi:hypothetical protein
MNETERNLDLLVAELEHENRLIRARNERLEREAQQAARDHADELMALAMIERGRVAREAIDRLVQGGQGAAVSILKHHFQGIAQ